MTTPPDVVEFAQVARGSVTKIAELATDLNDDDRRAIMLAADVLVATCEAARRRVDDCLRIEDDLGRRLNDLERPREGVGAPGDPEPPPEEPDPHAIEREHDTHAIERELARTREVLAGLPRAEGESEYDFGARKDRLRDRIRDLERQRRELAGETEPALAKALRVFGGATR